MSKPCILGIDVGTSSVKVIAVTQSGQAIGHASHPYPMSSPAPGWHEQDPADWWAATIQCVREVVAAVVDSDVAAIGITGQMHSLVLVDDDLNPVRNSILWNDGRTVDELAEMRDRLAHVDYFGVTFNRIRNAFTAPKLLWVKRHDERAYQRARHALLPKDWIKARLTGVVSTDPNDGSGTGLMDVRDSCWSRNVLELLDLPERLLPEIRPSLGIAGGLTGAAAELLGLKKGTPVVNGSGDQAAAGLAMGLVKPGRVGLALGTSAALFHIVHEPRVDSMAYVFPSTWLQLTSLHSAGDALAWARSVLQLPSGGESAAHDFSEPTDGVLFFPFLAGERDAEMNLAELAGLSLSTSPLTIQRAVVQGISFELRRLLSAKLGADPDTVAATGGLTHDKTFMQCLSDVLGRPITAYGEPCGSALGAAMLAGAGALGENPWRDWTTSSQTTYNPSPHQSTELGTMFAHYVDAYEVRFGESDD